MYEEEYTMEYVTLNNGEKMPMEGIGTFLLKPEGGGCKKHFSFYSGRLFRFPFYLRIYKL